MCSSFSKRFRDSLSLSGKVSDVKEERGAERDGKKGRRSIKCPSVYLVVNSETDKQTAACYRLITQRRSLIWAPSASLRAHPHWTVSASSTHCVALLKNTYFYPVFFIHNCQGQKEIQEWECVYSSTIKVDITAVEYRALTRLCQSERKVVSAVKGCAEYKNLKN